MPIDESRGSSEVSASSRRIILDRTTRDSVFLNVVSRTIGRTLVSGPFGLPGFCINMSTPLPRPSGSCCFSCVVGRNNK